MDNFYPLGTHCEVLGFCGQGEAQYNLTSLDRDLRPEWTFAETDDQTCERCPGGSLACVPSNTPFECCVNMIAVRRDGVVCANREDGNLYAVDRWGNEVGKVFLELAIGAAYTPLAIADDGRILKGRYSGPERRDEAVTPRYFPNRSDFTTPAPSLMVTRRSAATPFTCSVAPFGQRTSISADCASPRP